jgi:dihydrofolate reductase
VLSGNSTLTSAVLEHGLADEVVLIISPVLLGTGKRLFAEGNLARGFTLVSTNAFPSGVILGSFKAAGGLQSA